MTTSFGGEGWRGGVGLVSLEIERGMERKERSFFIFMPLRQQRMGLGRGERVLSLEMLV